MPKGCAALVGQQVHGDRPALVLSAQDPLRGYHNILEEDFAELGQAVHGLYRPYGDARAVHVDEEGGDAPVGGFLCSGAGKKNAPLRILGQARPDLLSVHPPLVAVSSRPAAERREIAARAGF
jgi:hypothetical protein